MGLTAYAAIGLKLGGDPGGRGLISRPQQRSELSWTKGGGLSSTAIQRRSCMNPEVVRGSVNRVVGLYSFEERRARLCFAVVRG